MKGGGFLGQLRDCHLSSLTLLHGINVFVRNERNVSEFYMEIHRDDLDVQKRTGGGGRVLKSSSFITLSRAVHNRSF
jgi:hypothetical protein